MRLLMRPKAPKAQDSLTIGLYKKFGVECWVPMPRLLCCFSFVYGLFLKARDGWQKKIERKKRPRYLPELTARRRPRLNLAALATAQPTEKAASASCFSPRCEWRC